MRRPAGSRGRAARRLTGERNRGQLELTLLEDQLNVPINAKRLRASLPQVVERVRKGTRFTVIYRSRPAFQIVPVTDPGGALTALEEDSLYRADAVGSSTDGRTAADHDAILYPR